MNYASLKAAIQAVIKQNGNEEITGDLLQQSLLAMINALGVGYQFVGVATPATNPTIGDEKIMYIAVDSGTYSNFVTPAVTLDGSQIAIFLYSTSWSAILLNVPNGAYIATELAKKVDKVAGKGLSTNDFTDVLKARLENSLVTSDIVQSLGDDETKVISQAAMTEILLNYARIDGYYSSLIAGAAENLVGRGSVPALFTFRTTGGSADVGSGTAQIKKLYGNSIVWNSMVKNGNFANTNDWVAESGVTFTVADGVAHITKSTSANNGIRQVTPYIANHKYLLSVQVYCETATTIRITYTGNVSVTKNIEAGKWETISGIASDTSDKSNIYILEVGETGHEFLAKSVKSFDLTLMLGTGNEPATVAEFETLYWLKYYAFNPGQIVNNGAAGIKTVGFNQWDEIAELGGINVQGQNVNTYTDRLRGKNYIPVFPQTTYYFKTKSGLASGDVFFYDANKTFISALFGKGNNTFITPSNCHYIRIALTAYYGTTYNNDVCINLSWSGYRNGEYEPYWERTINLPLTTMTGKLNGEGESVVIAPDGWMSAGDARFVGIIENGMLTKVEKHVKQVDMETLAWSAATSTETVQRFMAPLTGAKSVAFTYDVANLLSSRFVTKSIQSLNAGNGGDIGQYSTNVYCSAPLGTYADADAFKAAMDGVKLNYELATPEVYVLDEPINMNYSEDDFGTEERLPADTADNVSAPIFFDVQYPMNAVDMLRRLGINYIKKESTDHILQAFVNAGIIGSYTLTYNATNDDYDCVVTAPVTP